MAAPTNEEQQLLVTFRGRVGDILETEDQRKDSFLLRWIRARDLDLNKAEDMLRTSLAWRKENKINFILESPVDNYTKKEFPIYVNSGVDKQGQPILVIPIGKWDLRKCVAQGKTEDFKHFMNYCFEDTCRGIENLDKKRDPDKLPITQFTAIMDWKGYSYMQLCSIKAIQNILYTGSTFEAHYPEILSSCVFVNCPGFFSVALALIKKVLAARTFEKITVFGSNRQEWEDACREIIDNDQLDEILKILNV